MKKHTGGFTLPGEVGYEQLTLDLCKLWGADCIRDSDGTQLSDEILNSGAAIYSTLCVVRSINDFARSHPQYLQRNFLMSQPVLSAGGTLEIDPLKGYFQEQFIIQEMDDPYRYWQVFDRSSGQEIFGWKWENKRVYLPGTQEGHVYTVNFLATRIWEEISMYNHVTNDWGDKEHLMAVEPRYPEVQQALVDFMKQWLAEHPRTDVVRFTSMFYNFCWFWGDEPGRRDVFTDWGSYDFAVNPLALEEFEREYGYRLTSEDFVNGGRYRPSHTPPTPKQLDWMAFTGKFVRKFGRELIDVVHAAGRKAYVFYDDSWIGIEPWSGHFREFGFDGLIKCVFNAFEARLCAGVDVDVHELRLHPYLFPTGLSGLPTFAPGGHPEIDAWQYWMCIRRALLRKKIDRIGLGGYLHLVEPYPEFVEAIRDIADEFRTLKALHEAGEPWSSGIRIGILQSWGSLRTWNCAGHMHEHPELPLNHIHEALAGLPVELRSISLAEVAEHGVPEDVDVLINAGRAGDAWSGGEIWRDARLKAAVNRFVLHGGAFIGVCEPSAAEDGQRVFQLREILGVEKENGATVCIGRYNRETAKDHFILKDLPDPEFANGMPHVYIADGETLPLKMDGEDVILSVKETGKGRCVYMNGFTYSPVNAQLLYRTLLWATHHEELGGEAMPDNPLCECAYYPQSGRMAVINNSGEEQSARIGLGRKAYCVKLNPFEMRILDV
ncbi:MAG: 1,3-beta-galactosyl-N-acetylhexosamine phosphorylase [Clostridia bacterium]|nr:1,3-beta-galactosyl-N-acetylhexosamine phosphorylase [Clostridia bacterium]